ncbi:SpnB-like Rossmann fold domain-containing protein, partial [Streptomyces graminilatus]|uniref:SpnB-like Rossmann fold domain-containing protein n=1 Tax=Streptomyces graminilatus TaxID=1464070 RepID=UPI001F51E993
MHPALLDGALHAVGVGGVGGFPVGVSLLPFSWSGVVVRGAGSGVLRVRLGGVDGGEGVSLRAVDGGGVPVVSVERLSLRAVSAGQVGRAGSVVRDEALFGVEWLPAAGVAGLPAGSEGAAGRWLVVGDDAVSRDVAAGLVAAGAQVEAAPEWGAVSGPASAGDGAGLTVVLCCPAGSDSGSGSEEGSASGSGLVDGVWSLVEVLGAWLGDGCWEGSRLVVVTRGGVAAGVGEPVDVGGAALWGLVRSAQLENPGRLSLVDVDDAVGAGGLLPGVVASGEDQVAVRDGGLRVPRLVRVAVPEPASASEPASEPASESESESESAFSSSSVSPSVALPGVWGSGSVLVTGGTGGLGALVARHLVVVHGVRDLVLVSRRGVEAPGAAGLLAELVELGCDVDIVACDVSD